MKTLFVVLTTLLFSACGTHTPQYSVAPETQSYVDEFYAAAKKEGVAVQQQDLIVKMGELADDKEAGLCEHAETPTVTIDNSNWRVLDDSMRRAVVAHELGHCLLNRGHLSTMMNVQWPAMISYSTTQPASVMNPLGGNIIMGDMAGLKDFYFHELFHPGEN